jgi:hypothetical protein
MEASSGGSFWISNAHKISPALVGVENKGFAFFELLAAHGFSILTGRIAGSNETIG